MKKQILTLAIILLSAETAYAGFGETKPRPVATPAPAPVVVAAPAPALTPVPAPVVTPAPAAVKPTVITVTKPKPATKPKPKKLTVTKPVDSEKLKQDQTIKFVHENISCSKAHAWSRIKDSGYSEATAPSRVTIAVNASIKPYNPGCQSWLAQHEPKPAPAPKPVAKPAFDQAKDSVIEKSHEGINSISDVLGKIGNDIKTKGITERSCTQSQKMMNQC